MDKSVEISINSNEFVYNGVTYDVERAVNKDKKLIIDEANGSHKESFEELYDTESLSPNFVRLFLNKKDEIVYAMVIYVIRYKNLDYGRYACGNYYPIYNSSTGKNYLQPHPYQASICW